MKLPVFFALACLPFAGCVGSPEGSMPGPDSESSPDNGSGGESPAPSPGGDDELPPLAEGNVCPSSPDLSLDGLADAYVYTQEEGASVIEIGVPLAGEEGLSLVVELWEGYGPFEDGLQTGTFSITGAETQLSECSTCVLVGSELASNLLVADGGSVTVSAVSTTAGSEVSVSLSDISLREVTIDDVAQSETDVEGGCSATLTSGTLTADLQAGE